MGATYWGCDIGGCQNTFITCLDVNTTAFTTRRLEGSTTDIAQHVWRESGDAVAPVILVLDAVLSHDLDSAQGWRPADRLIRSLLDHHLTSAPGASVVVSPNAFMGHRHLELSTVYGALGVVAETHPTACMAFMGAPLEDLREYKHNPGALERVGKWLLQSWFADTAGPPREHGALDALVCAMVAAAIGGAAFRGLDLFTPVLGLPCESPGELPRPSLSGAAPYYLLRNAGAFQRFLEARRDNARAGSVC
jgi:hypothetical protein